MRRGTSALGADVPSEREINRLAARNEEEFWLFEKMDEERRQRERYRSRLMEENEVPEWVFPKNTENKAKEILSPDAQSNQVSGKRQRKEVVYADLLSDIQWMKAVEEGEDLSKLAARVKRKEHPSDAHESVASEENSENISSKTLKKLQGGAAEKDDSEGEVVGEVVNSSWQNNIVTWKTHKRKRSSHGYSSSSSDVKGRQGL